MIYPQNNKDDELGPVGMILIGVGIVGGIVTLFSLAGGLRGVIWAIIVVLLGMAFSAGGVFTLHLVFMLLKLIWNGLRKLFERNHEDNTDDSKKTNNGH